VEDTKNCLPLFKAIPFHREYNPVRNIDVHFCRLQAAGTRGTAIISGAESVRIHDEYYPVRVQSEFIDGLSAHADYREMTKWLAQMKKPPKRTFIIHGEPQNQDTFRRYLGDQLGWYTEIPSHGDSVTLE